MTLDLPEKTKDELRELRELSRQAEDGDLEARVKLQRRVKAASPEIVAEASNLAALAETPMVKFVSAGDTLMREALPKRLALMRAEIAGENPTPLEILLSERIVSCWLLVQVVEALAAQQIYSRYKKEKTTLFSLPFQRYVLKWHESASSRYLAAIKDLARVRKLQMNTPNVQVNTQINVIRP